MGDPVGPAQERLTVDHASSEQFNRAVGSLADGALIFPAPFDLATAAGLAANDIDGADAVDVEAATRGEIGLHYHVQITQIVDGRPDLRRPVVDTTVADPRLLRSLLGDVARLTTSTEGHS